MELANEFEEIDYSVEQMIEMSKSNNFPKKTFFIGNNNFRKFLFNKFSDKFNFIGDERKQLLFFSSKSHLFIQVCQIIKILFSSVKFAKENVMHHLKKSAT